ncbi:MAG: hypothetical protein Q4A05_05270 [Ruminococcus sp.]|nr:hypothetical protein [Ruminococcus sp.]
MKNIIKKITAAALALTLLGTGTLVRDNSNLVDNKQVITADAASGGYIKYRDVNDYIAKVLKGQRGVRCMNYYVPTYHFMDFRYGRAHRGAYDIPNGMNCTVISVENLMVYYLRKNGFPAVTDAGYSYYYNGMMDLARNKYGYTDKSGLPVWNHRSFCQEALRAYGHFSSTPNVSTYSRSQRSITLPNLPNKPFILSSTTTYHSVLVYSTVTWHLEYTTKQGYKMSEDVDFLECYDPSGERFMVETGNIVDSWNDIEQVMYVTNY